MLYNLNNMSSLEVMNILLNKEKRNEFLADMLNQKETLNEAVGDIIDKIMPYKNRSPLPQEYQMYVMVILDYEKYIDYKDLKGSFHSFEYDFFHYASLGIHSYIEQTHELRMLVK